MSHSTSIQEPTILTANTYFWKPGFNAGSRRSSEQRNLSTVAEFFRQIGMDVTEAGGEVIGVKDGIVACFSYSESCHNVYKHLSITRDGKASNITQLRKLY